MAHSIEEAQDVILGKINLICGRFGLNNIMAQLYVILYLNNAPMSLNEMAKRLKISKGSISINIRALERYGVVKKVWVKGTRQDYYEAEYDIAKVVMQRVKSMAENRLSEVEDMILFSSQILDSIELKSEEERRSKEAFGAKIEKIKLLYEQGRQLFDLFSNSLLPHASAALSDAVNTASSEVDRKTE